MGYSVKIQKAAADRLSQRRLTAKRESDFRREEIFAKLPKAAELEKGIADSGIKAARAVVSGGNVTEVLEGLKRQNLAMQEELERILVSNGYPADALEPQYSCKRCSDTGYYDENGRTLMCSCLKQALTECACEELNRHAPLKLSTFESFNVDLYPDETDSNGVNPHRHMERVVRYCTGYAGSFTPESKSLLMCGATGLGKTHLSLAIANEVIKRGYGVIYVSAPAIIAHYESQMRSRSDTDELLDMATDCDLLIIDDLGSEFINQFSVSHIYNLINSRLLSRKPVIINTNLTMRELEKSYSYRLVSRLNGEAEKLNFFGKDIRIAKKRNN
ncbi:ATP-binding protein [Lachnoclostridium sp. MSJ-17]|uniref:ATP-binding protein n=1 Tax=Lachnoclostridium sp. MSJ-17 TaxID=2841516 RepID=UPI001C121610|nr:ATP-binding protein [Lachnoclostridium sp. MSJ-17]MBU5461719.1 ATP-binding protein [Lachnoclostridium sp. MSJ-17]